MMHRIVIAAVVLASAVTVRGAGEKNVDWPLHNLDLHNSRFSPLAQITSANAGTLALKWTFETSKAESIGSITPLVVDGVM